MLFSFKTLKFPVKLVHFIINVFLLNKYQITYYIIHTITNTERTRLKSLVFYKLIIFVKKIINLHQNFQHLH